MTLGVEHREKAKIKSRSVARTDRGASNPRSTRMATTATNLRSRRSEAQLHALNDVQRHIRAVDPSARRKYLREFNEVFDAYRSVISPTEMKQLVASSDVVLVGDY